MSDLIEIKEKVQVSREEAAARLRDIADQLARHNDLEFERGGMRIKAKVPDQVNLKLEFEISDDETEMEIELTW
jgi:amphi-Trp domain-containing protein